MDKPEPDSSSSEATSSEPGQKPTRSRAERFLGESDDGRTRGPVGARVVAMISILTLLVLVLLAAVFSFEDRLGERVLLTVSVPTYDSTLVTPLEFVDQDLAQIRSAPGVQLSPLDGQDDLRNFSTQNDLSDLMQNVLPDVQQDTLVVFVRMHAISDNGELYLLPSDVDPFSPAEGVNIRSFLEELAAAPASNKLVLLDLGGSQQLGTGWFGNNVQDNLEGLFEELFPEDTENASSGNLCLICATGNQQPSWSSVSVQHSVFGGLAGYCLHGGSAADGAGPNGNAEDGLLSVSEMAAFLERSVADWSLTHLPHSDGGQIPFHLPANLQERDFYVARVDDFLTLDSYFANREQLANAGNAENERRREEFEQRTGDSGAADELRLVPTTDDLVEKLSASWQRRQQLAFTSAPVQRPRHWALHHQELRRAESLMLAGRLEDAADVIDTFVVPLEEDLRTEPAELIRDPWSVGFTDLIGEEGLSGRWSEAVQSAIELPTRTTLDRLRTAPYVEAELLQRVRDRLVTGTTAEDASWTDSGLLQLVIGTRALSERVARLTCPRDIDPAAEGIRSMPELYYLVSDDIERADRARIAAELELAIGHLEAGREKLETVAAEYESLRRICDVYRGQLRELHVTLIEAEALAEWLAMAPGDTAWREETAGRLAALLRGAAEFSRNPQPELLAPLVALCRDLRQTAMSTVNTDNADPAVLRAALELPFLAAELRTRVLKGVIERNDAPTSAVALHGFQSEGVPGFDAGWEVALAFAKVLGDDRSETPMSFRDMLSKLNTDDLPLVKVRSEASGYEQFVTHLIRAPFQTALLRAAEFQATATEDLMARMSADHLVWQLARLDAVQDATGGDVTAARSVILDNLIAINPSFQESQRRSRHPFSTSNVQVTTTESEDELELSLQVNGSLKLTEADDPHFVIDWFALRQRWSVQSAAGSGPVANGETSPFRIRVPVLDLVTRNRADVLVTLKSAFDRGDEPLQINDELPCWIEIADGSRYWAPLRLEVGADLLAPLKLVVAGPEGTLLPDVVKVYPNQRLPIDVQVHGNRADVQDVSVELTSGTAKRSFNASLASPGVWAGHDAAFRMPVANAHLNLRAVASGEVVDSRRLTVEVMNPRRSFAADLEYDAETRTASATIRRLEPSAVTEDVPVQMVAHNVGVEGGNLRGTLPADARETTVDATLSDSPATRYEVSVGVCGVPGVFHFRIDPVSGVVTPFPRIHVGIEHPPAGTAFVYTNEQSAHVPVGISADGDDECIIHVGLDRNNDGYLETSERLETFNTWSGKIVETNLLASLDPAELAIESNVSEVVARIPASGRVGSQRILAQLAVGPPASRTLYFVQTPPAVVFESPRQNDAVYYGDPLSITLSSDSKSSSAVELVEVGVDRNNNGKWDEGETLNAMVDVDLPAVPFVRSNRTTAIYDSHELLDSDGETESTAGGEDSTASEEPLLPQRLVLMARAVTPLIDPADPSAEVRREVSSVSRRIITLNSQSDKPVPNGQISGYVVTVDGLAQRDVQITFGEAVTQTDDDGNFQFSEVPPGVYVLEARRGLRAGQVEVEVVAGETTDNVEIVIVR